MFFKREVQIEKSNALGMGDISKNLTISDKQTGKTIQSIDKKRVAAAPGKRISKTGKTYYEYRKNRSDLKGGI